MHFYVAVISNLYSFNSFGKEIPSLFSVAEKIDFLAPLRLDYSKKSIAVRSAVESAY